MQHVFSPEIWDEDRQVFVFRCYPEARVERWTFMVSPAALLPLGYEGAWFTGFGCCRGAIYAAAERRMLSGHPEQDQVLSARDLIVCAVALR